MKESSKYQMAANSPVASDAAGSGSDPASPLAIRPAPHSATSASSRSSVTAARAGIECISFITPNRPKTPPSSLTRAPAPANVRLASTNPQPAPPLSAANDTSGWTSRPRCRASAAAHPTDVSWAGSRTTVFRSPAHRSFCGGRTPRTTNLHQESHVRAWKKAAYPSTADE